MWRRPTAGTLVGMTNPYPHSQPEPQPYRSPGSEGARRLTRSRADKMLGGVCGGAAAYVGVDPTVMRLLFVAATVLTSGAGILLYLAGWFLMPQD